MMHRSLAVPCVAVAAGAAPSAVMGQSVTELVAQANHEYEAREVPAALKHYEAALAKHP